MAHTSQSSDKSQPGESLDVRELGTSRAKLSTRPAIFVELGNMSIPTDAARADARERLANALQRGVTRLLAG